MLSHSSGLEQGIGGYATMLRDKTVRTTNAEQAEKYAKQPLDFEPGIGTGYSPIAGFDVLISVIESASGEKADDYFRNHIFLPLDMNNSTFHPTQKEKENLVQIYKKSGKSLKNVTGKKADMKSFFTIAEGSDYVSGSGGLYSTAEDYEHFLYLLEELGYEVKQGAHLAVKADKMRRFRRLDTISEEYSKENLENFFAKGSFSFETPYLSVTGFITLPTVKQLK